MWILKSLPGFVALCALAFSSTSAFGADFDYSCTRRQYERSISHFSARLKGNHFVASMEMNWDLDDMEIFKQIAKVMGADGEVLQPFNRYRFTLERKGSQISTVFGDEDRSNLGYLTLGVSEDFTLKLENVTTEELIGQKDLTYAHVKIEQQIIRTYEGTDRNEIVQRWNIVSKDLKGRIVAEQRFKFENCTNQITAN